MKAIDKSSRLPLYYQLMDILIHEIEDQTLKVGDKLLSERELCECFDLSRSTVRLAIQEMEREGYIEKKHGKGTFVSEQRLKQNLLNFYSFTEEMKKIGKTPSSLVLSFEQLPCDARTAKKMALEIGAPVYRFERLRLADNDPMLLETTYVPGNRFENLTREDLEQSALYDIFRNRYMADLTMAEETFRPVMVNDQEAKRLQMEPTQPSLMIERTTYEGNNVVEYTMSLTRGDRFRYTVILKK